jgi:hypothetical protein
MKKKKKKKKRNVNSTSHEMRIKSLLAAALAKVPNFIRPFNINQRFGLLCVRVSVDKVFLRAEVYRPRVPLPL